MPKNNLDQLRFQILTKSPSVIKEACVTIRSSTPTLKEIEESSHNYSYLYENNEEAKGWRNDPYHTSWDCKSHWSFPMCSKLRRKIDKIILNDSTELHRWATQIHLPDVDEDGKGEDGKTYPCRTFIEYFLKTKGKHSALGEANWSTGVLKKSKPQSQFNDDKVVRHVPSRNTRKTPFYFLSGSNDGGSSSPYQQDGSSSAPEFNDYHQPTPLRIYSTSAPVMPSGAEHPSQQQQQQQQQQLYSNANSGRNLILHGGSPSGMPLVLSQQQQLSVSGLPNLLGPNLSPTSVDSRSFHPYGIQSHPGYFSHSPGQGHQINLNSAPLEQLAAISTGSRYLMGSASVNSSANEKSRMSLEDSPRGSKKGESDGIGDDRKELHKSSSSHELHKSNSNSSISSEMSLSNSQSSFNSSNHHSNNTNHSSNSSNSNSHDSRKSSSLSQGHFTLPSGNAANSGLDSSSASTANSSQSIISLLSNPTGVSGYSSPMSSPMMLLTTPSSSSMSNGNLSASPQKIILPPISSVGLPSNNNNGGSSSSSNNTNSNNNSNSNSNNSLYLLESGAANHLVSITADGGGGGGGSLGGSMQGGGAHYMNSNGNGNSGNSSGAGVASMSVEPLLTSAVIVEHQYKDLLGWLPFIEHDLTEEQKVLQFCMANPYFTNYVPNSMRRTLEQWRQNLYANAISIFTMHSTILTLAHGALLKTKWQNPA